MGQSGDDDRDREIEALRTEIEMRRERRKVTLGRVAHLVETIDRLSGTIRRLGINATIEAARLGDAGAPFAIVANEIKGLSRVMQEATDEAAELLRDRHIQ